LNESGELLLEISTLTLDASASKQKQNPLKTALQKSALSIIFIHMDEYSALDLVFSALAHPTRRRMLDLLAVRDLCVTELADHFPGALNVVSKHIKSLERAGLVSRHHQGRVHRLALRAAPLAEAEEFIGRYRARWERKLDRLENYMNELSKTRSIDGKSKKNS
jgi:DNA-binding transcriptional ArsR family regulator